MNVIDNYLTPIYTEEQLKSGIFIAIVTGREFLGASGSYFVKGLYLSPAFVVGL